MGGHFGGTPDWSIDCELERDARRLDESAAGLWGTPTYPDGPDVEALRCYISDPETLAQVIIRLTPR